MTFVVTESGRMVDAETERIAQLIADYDPNLELAWIEPEKRTLNDTHPFAVIYHNPNTGQDEIVFRLRETEVDHRVIARIWSNDSRNGNVLDSIEKEENARQALEMLRQMDEEAERQELAAWMINAKPGAITPNGTRLQ